MNTNANLNLRALAAKAALVLIVAAVALGITGCGNNQMVRIEENQLKLQALVELNTEQLGAFQARTEQSGKDLRTAMEDLKKGTQSLAVDITAIAQEHAKLQGMVRANDSKLTDKIAIFEQRQQDLQLGIDDVTAGTTKVAADIAAVGAGQTKLQKMIETNNRALIAKVAAMEQNQDKLLTQIENVSTGAERLTADLAALAQAHEKLDRIVQDETLHTAEKVADIEHNQQQRQTEVDNVRNSVQKVADSVAALEKNLAKLQQLLQNDTRNLADVIKVVGQGQIEFEGKVERDIRGLADSLKNIGQDQAKLAKQVEDVRTNTKAMIDSMVTTLDSLKTQLSPVASAKNTETAKSADAPSPPKEKD